MTPKPKKKPPENPVKQSDADAFAMYVHKWQRELNLMDWRIVQSTKRAKSNCAEINRCHLEDRLASYRIGENFGAEPVTALSLERTAVHELLHVFLREYKEFCKDPASNDKDIESAEHRVVNVLEKLLVPEAE